MFLRKGRLFIIVISFFIIAIAILSRFFYLQIISHEKLERYARKRYEKIDKKIMPRGKIYDLNGNLLVDSIVNWDVVITTPVIKDEDLKRLSEVLSIPQKEITSRIKPTTRYLKIKRGIDKEKYDALKEIPSVYLEPHQTRIYPAQTARELIGLANENSGLSGVEFIYDKYLKGNIVVKEIIKDVSGNIIRKDEREISEESSDIYLTIENEIQAILENTIKEYHKTLEAERIIAIVQNSKNGFISAVASYPPNYINFIPIEYVYEPGSTMKTFILAAGFEEGVISEDNYINCENGTWKITPRYTITDHERLGEVKLIDVYTHSSNIGFAKIGLKIGISRLYPYIRKFGFGNKYTEFPGESRGIIKEFDKYKEIDLITTSYGYGIAVTPIQLINAYTAVANKGKLLKPHIVYKIKNKNSETLIAKKEIIREVISPQTAQRITKMMIEVVEKGTGINARINGYTIAGKTGTANKLDPKTFKYMKGKNVTSFCGFFPASDPHYTILIIVDNSERFKYGGQTSAPIFRDIAKQIISIKNIKPDKEFDNKPESNRLSNIVN